MHINPKINILVEKGTNYILYNHFSIHITYTTGILLPALAMQCCLEKSTTASLGNIPMDNHRQRRSPECTAMKAIFSQNTVNVACKKN